MQEEARSLLEQVDLIPPTPDKAPSTPLPVGPPIPFRHQLLVEAGNLPTGDARIATGLDPGDGYDSDASASSSHSSSHAVMRCSRARGAATNNDAMDEVIIWTRFQTVSPRKPVRNQVYMVYEASKTCPNWFIT